MEWANCCRSISKFDGFKSRIGLVSKTHRHKITDLPQRRSILGDSKATGSVFSVHISVQTLGTQLWIYKCSGLMKITNYQFTLKSKHFKQWTLIDSANGMIYVDRMLLKCFIVHGLNLIRTSRILNLRYFNS